MCSWSHKTNWETGAVQTDNISKENRHAQSRKLNLVL